MTRNIYPSYYELGKGSVVIARRALIKAYQETGNICEVARLFRTTRKTAKGVTEVEGGRGGRA